MNITITNEFSQDLTTLIIPMLKQKSLNGWLSVLSNLLNIPEELLISDFKGKHKEVFTTYWNGQRVILLGLGENIEQQKIIEAFRSLSHKTKNRYFDRVGVDFINFQMETTFCFVSILTVVVKVSFSSKKITPPRPVPKI